MTVDTVRVTKQGRDQLIMLKRRTGVKHWNVLCRWAFCVSLAERSRPRKQASGGDAPIEMTWRTFAGEFEDVYLALLKQRCIQDGLSLQPSTLASQLRMHVHRGISYLVGDKGIDGIASLVRQAPDVAEFDHGEDTSN